MKASDLGRCLIAGACMLFVAGCGGGNGDKGPDPREQAPPSGPRNLAGVVLEPLDGPPRTIGDYEGRFLVVNFFATWSKDSQALVPIMNRIEFSFGANATVIWIAVDDRGKHALRNFINDNNLRSDVFTGGAAIAGRFGGAGRIPTTYILTRESRIFGRVQGLGSYDDYHKHLLGMVKQRM